MDYRHHGRDAAAAASLPVGRAAPDGRLFLFFTLSFDYFDGRAGSWLAVCANPDVGRAPAGVARGVTQQARFDDGGRSWSGGLLLAGRDVSGRVTLRRPAIRGRSVRLGE